MIDKHHLTPKINSDNYFIKRNSCREKKKEKKRRVTQKTNFEYR